MGNKQREAAENQMMRDAGGKDVNCGVDNKDAEKENSVGNVTEFGKDNLNVGCEIPPGRGPTVGGKELDQCPHELDGGGSENGKPTLKDETSEGEAVGGDEGNDGRGARSVVEIDTQISQEFLENRENP